MGGNGCKLRHQERYLIHPSQRIQPHFHNRSREDSPCCFQCQQSALETRGFSHIKVTEKWLQMLFMVSSALMCNCAVIKLIPTLYPGPNAVQLKYRNTPPPARRKGSSSIQQQNDPLKSSYERCLRNTNNANLCILRTKRFRAISDSKERGTRVKTARKMARVKELSFHFSQGQNQKSRSTVFLRRLKSLWLKKLSSTYRPSSW